MDQQERLLVSRRDNKKSLAPQHLEEVSEDKDADADYQRRVEAAKATCRQRKYCTYGMVGVYLIFIYLYVKRKKGLLAE